MLASMLTLEFDLRRIDVAVTLNLPPATSTCRVIGFLVGCLSAGVRDLKKCCSDFA